MKQPKPSKFRSAAQNPPDLRTHGNQKRKRRKVSMRFVFRLDPAPLPVSPFDVIAILHDGARVLIGTAGNPEDAESLSELVAIRPGGDVAAVVIERRSSKLT